MQYEILTRRQAADLGRKKFYTGRPCSSGHLAQRFVSTGGCVACNTERSRSFSNRPVPAFTYNLHPDDHAAALAYCQALDLARGKVPHIPQAQPVPASVDAVELPEFIARHRAQLIAANTPAAVAYYPEP